MTLAIPALAERSLKEKIQLILSFFLEESQRIQKNIHIRYEALKQLTFTHFEANVGESGDSIYERTSLFRGVRSINGNYLH